MRVLLTGGMGYIGSHAAVALVEAGHEPRAGYRQAAVTSGAGALDAERRYLDTRLGQATP